MRNASDKSCGEIQNAHFMFDNFFSKNHVVYEKCGKVGTAGQATDNNTIWCMSFACWIIKARDTLRICNTYYFSMAALVMRTCLKVMLYVHCFSHRIIFTLLSITNDFNVIFIEGYILN
jgi:hypothetical protein